MGWRAQGPGGSRIDGDTLGLRAATEGAAQDQDTAGRGRPLGPVSSGTEGRGGGISIKIDNDSKRPQGTHSLNRKQHGGEPIGAQG